MKTKIPLLLLLLTLLVVFASWVMNAFGLSVQTLVSTDGLRWWFAHVGTHGHSSLIVLSLLAVMTLGLAQEVRSYNRSTPQTMAHPPRHRVILLTLSFATLWLLLLALLLLVPHALLLNAEGRLWPSPYLEGLIVFLFTGILLDQLLYLWLMGHIRSWDDTFRLLTTGFTTHAWLILTFLLLDQLLIVIEYL